MIFKKYLFIVPILAITIFLTSRCMDVIKFPDINPQCISFCGNSRLIVAQNTGIILVDTHQGVLQTSLVYNNKKDITKIIPDKSQQFFLIEQSSSVNVLDYVAGYNIGIDNTLTLNDKIKTIQDHAHLGYAVRGYFYFDNNNNIIKHILSSSHKKNIIMFNDNDTPHIVESKYNDLDYNPSVYRNIALHPLKNNFLIPYHYHIYLETNFENFDYFIQLEEGDVIVDVSYNHDGSFIIINEKQKGIIIITNEEKSEYLSHSIKDKRCKKRSYLHYCAMAINCYNILALLCWDQTIQLWDCKTKKLIHTIHIDQSESLTKDQRRKICQRLSFSPDGTQLAAALKNACLVYSLPLKLYFPRKYLMYHIWYSLNNLDHLDIFIPQDIIMLILNIIRTI